MWDGRMDWLRPQLRASSSGGLRISSSASYAHQRYEKAPVPSMPVARLQLPYPLVYLVQIDSIVACHTRLTAHHAESLRGVFESPFAVAASTNAGPALGLHQAAE